MSFAPPLSAADVGLFETFVVPRYLSFFAGIAADMLIAHPAAQIAHIGCRTGYPDSLIIEKLPGSSLIGVDPSRPAIELARTNASLISGVHAAYHVTEGLPTPLHEASFTHALTLHPICNAEDRGHLLAELRRVLVPGGQAVISMPLRGSFPEMLDMIREFALRQDLPEVGKAVDAAASSRPTIETVSEELENAGLGDVDVDVQLIAVSFANGREFLEDPIARLVVLADLRANLAVEPQIIDASFKYLQDAIGKYWSEGVFELTVNVGCASARRM